MTGIMTGVVGLICMVGGAFARSAAKKLGSQITFKPSQTNGVGSSGSQSISFWEMRMHEAVKSGVREELAIAVVPSLQANQKALDELVKTNASMDKNLALLVALQQRLR